MTSMIEFVFKKSIQNYFMTLVFPFGFLMKINSKTYVKKYTLISEFMSEDGDNQIDGIRIYHKGFYYKLKTKYDSS